MTAERRKELGARTIVAALPALLFADVLLGIHVLYTRDVSQYHFPLRHVLREIVSRGDFPYWNPWIAAGQPLAANPAHQLFYPLTWLIFLPDFVFGFHLHAILHLSIASLGTYLLVRSLGAGRAAGVICALSFGIGGLIASTLNLFPFLFSMAWIPWICLYARRALRDGGRRNFALAALFLALQLLVGEPMTTLQTGMLLGLYALFRGRQALARRIGLLAALGAVAALLAAVQLIPAIDHFRDSVRARGIPFEVASHWSMPPIRVAELVNPQLLGDAEGENLQDFWGVGVYGKVRRPFFLSIYPGLLIAIGVATGIVRRVRGTALFVTTAALSILFAAGEHTPLLRWAHDAGIAGAVRYPEKFIILGIFAGIVYAARPLDALFSGDRAALRVARIIAAAILTTTGALALLGTTRFHEPLFRAVWRVPQGLEAGGMLAASQSGWMRSAAAALVLLLLLAAMPRLRRSLAIVLAGIFVVAELGSLSTRIAPRAPAAFYDPPPAVAKLPPNRDDYRVFHLAAEQRGGFADAYLRPQPDGEWLIRNAMTPYFPAAYGIRLVLGGDFDLTNLLPTDDLAAAMADFSNVSDEWVTPMAAMSNAQYVVLFRDPRLAFAEGRGEMRAVQPIEVRHAGAFPRYYFARQIVTIRDGRDLVQRLASKRHPLSTAFIHEAAFTPAPARVTRVSETTQSARIDVEARGRALLVMSVTPHKYWRITIDGAETRAMVTNLGYQSVVVPAGRHVVEMRYRNPLIAAGGAVSAAALLGLLLFARSGAPRPARED